MKILLDAFGGDLAPVETIKGARMATDTLGVQMILVGDKDKINAVAAENGVSLNGIQILHADSAITMEDDPGCVLNSKKDSSLAVGLMALKEGRADAIVTASNTGAVVVGATMLVGRIKGARRAALTTLIPCTGGRYLLMDVGANVECRPNMLMQFGIMGSVYMDKVVGVNNPRVGLANIGVEEHKGTPLQQEALQLLKKAPINFIGNAEVRDVPLGVADVVVADGFTGNVILKLTEGMAKMFTGELKNIMKKNALTMLGALPMMGGIKELKGKMSSREVGGAPLLGIAKPMIKAHGNSDATAFCNAVKQAVAMVNGNVIQTISSELAAVKGAEKKQEADN